LPVGVVTTGLQIAPAWMPLVAVGALVHEQRDVASDLRGGQPDAVGGAHRGEHVAHQRAQVVVELGDRLGLLMHHRLPHRVMGSTVPPVISR
jgi:hypothetical protein